MLGQHSAPTSSNEVLSFVLNCSSAKSDGLFSSDPVTAPSQFKQEVVQWLKQSEEENNINYCPPALLTPAPHLNMDTYYEFMKPMQSTSPPSLKLSPYSSPMDNITKIKKDHEVGSPSSLLNSSYSPPYNNNSSLQPYPNNLQPLASHPMQNNHPMLLQFLQSQSMNQSIYPAAQRIGTPSLPYAYQTNNYAYHYHPYVSALNSAQQKPFADRTNKGVAGQLHKNSICSNCQTTETPLWRWNANGQVECNACNIYQARNNRKRPVSLRKDKILRRKRNPQKPQNPQLQTA